MFASKTISGVNYSLLVMAYNDDVFEAVKNVAAKNNGGRFRPKQIKSYLIANGFGCDPKTIQNELQRGCINGPKDWSKMYARYERIKWGVYKLFEPEKKN